MSGTMIVSSTGPRLGTTAGGPSLRRPARRPVAVVAAEATCTCGQALERSHRAHCPRCGVTLRP